VIRGLLTIGLILGSTQMGASPGFSPLRAYNDFCVRYSSECRTDSNEPTHIFLTPSKLYLMQKVNLRVNRRVKPVTDFIHFGVEDYWEFPDDNEGDCEDYAIQKRKELRQLGFPHRAMRIGMVLDDQGLGHAVLVIRTDQGDYFLDNQRDRVLPKEEAGYKRRYIESPNGFSWEPYP
jgi:predicted transglutaminase-like cysteine proteinase